MQLNAAVSLDLASMTNDASTSAPPANAKARDSTKWLHKTKLCVYSVQGSCRLGSKCSFAHSSNEVQETPNLHKTQICDAFLQGQCSNENCSFAHGEDELRLSPNFKNKLCKWFGKGKCRNGDDCGFAHGVQQLHGKTSEAAVTAKVAVTPKQDFLGPPVTPPPGLTLSEPCVLDLDNSLLEDKAPLSMEDQVAGMTATIAALQRKMDSMVLQGQVSGMKQYLGELSAQFADLEQVVHQTNTVVTSTPQDIVSNAPWKKACSVTATKTPLKTKLSSKAALFQPSAMTAQAQPFMPGPPTFAYQTYENSWPFQECHDSSWPSDDSTSIDSAGSSSD